VGFSEGGRWLCIGFVVAFVDFIMALYWLCNGFVDLQWLCIGFVLASLLYNGLIMAL
jgi:hypothetical protein